MEKLRAEFPTVAFREYDIDAPGNSKLTSLYGAQGYPCFVVLDAGQVIEKHKGLQKFDPFSAHLRKKLTHASAPRW